VEVSGIAIVTDSASDLPAALLEQHRITSVPLEVRLAGLDAATLTAGDGEEFWRRAEATDEMAETSAPSPGDFATAFAEARDAGADGVLCITISSSLSATYQAACNGAAELDGSVAIEVVDSRLATMAQGLLVLHAAEMAAATTGLEELADRTRAAIDDCGALGALENLEALRRGGRIGSAQAFIGSLLSIKPVIELRDGVVEGESKQRTRAKSLRYVVDKIAALGPLAGLAVVHANAGDLDQLLGPLSRVFPSEQTIVTYIGPVVGAHTGVGSIGVCFRRAAATG
jgi:DegV family protein with EDD domain